MAFYTRVEPDPAVARAYVALFDAITLYRRAGRVAQASALGLVLRDIRLAYEKQGARSAAKADALIRDRLRQTQVRPDTPGPHLRDKIVSRPLPTTVPAGAFGIADLDVLDTAVNPRTGGIYWRAQEWGLPVPERGKPAPGFFQPGNARPNPAEFRVHPYFEQMSYARGMPALVRTRPLKARHYLRDGAELAYSWHVQQMRRISTEAVTALASI